MRCHDTKKLEERLQSPDIGHELADQMLRYEMTALYLSFGLMLVLLTGCLFIGWYFYAYPDFDNHGGRQFGSFMGVLIPLGLSLVFFAQLCTTFNKLLQAYLAPKYFLKQLMKRFE